MTTALIEGRFRGPDGIGNGGYVAGRMAALLGVQPAEVTLRRGWPVDVPLGIRRDGAAVQACDAEGNLVAEARAATLDLLPPAPPTRDEAAAATRWFLASPFTHSTGLCFVCGSAAPGGLGVFTGKVEGRPGMAAALWHPDARFADAAGSIAPEFSGPRSTAPGPSPSRWRPRRSACCSAASPGGWTAASCRASR
ncbi:hypothetical protein [Dankookia sp. P2]|uniref:hypothetical protein n=1 Tax=Dankookia sp. P2 TaxID=3423955 RepID=UPI003D677888